METVLTTLVSILANYFSRLRRLLRHRGALRVHLLDFAARAASASACYCRLIAPWACWMLQVQQKSRMHVRACSEVVQGK